MSWAYGWNYMNGLDIFQRENGKCHQTFGQMKSYFKWLRGINYVRMKWLAEMFWKMYNSKLMIVDRCGLSVFDTPECMNEILWQTICVVCFITVICLWQIWAFSELQKGAVERLLNVKSGACRKNYFWSLIVFVCVLHIYLSTTVNWIM